METARRRRPGPPKSQSTLTFDDDDDVVMIINWHERALEFICELLQNIVYQFL